MRRALLAVLLAPPLAAALLSLPLAAGTGMSAAAVGPLPDKSDQVVQYAIKVRLDSSSKQLVGTERLTWTNPSGDTVGELWFHTYLNAFKNTRTTFVKESGGQLRGDTMVSDSWGWIDVTSIRTAAGTDLTKQLVFAQPDDGNRDDQTVARLPLPEPVPPGGSVTLDIAFTAQLPRVFARTGFKNNFFLVGQWFPKLGVYEPAGLRGRAAGGWNCHQFHANSEFYANFGAYRVEITAPSTFVIGATGERKHEHTNGDGTTTYTYEQSDVHDFAWTADPNFVVVSAKFSAAQDVTPAEYQRVAQLLGRSLDEVTLSDVDITVLMQPEHLAQSARHVQAARDGLKWFGLWYGRYPYKTLTVVDPAYGAGGAGGMEYPTLITAGTSVLFNQWPLDRIRAPEAVTIHEFGHQYWYAMVANNEFEEAWLDEGINSYSTGKVMEAVYGPSSSMLEFLGLKMGEVDTLRMGNSPNAKFNRIIANAWSYTPSGAYGFYAYQKPEMVLRTLENFVGEQTMARVMRTFHERWRYKHPRSEDFFAVVNEVTGRDFTWYFDQVMRGTDVVDYEIGAAGSVRVAEPRGVIDSAKGRQLVTDADAAKRERQAEEQKTAKYDTTVVVRRRGEVYFPVEVAFRFAGRPVERLTWDGRDRTKTFTFVRAEKLEWVDIDPDRKVLLDVNWLNNGRRLQGDSRPAASWASRWMFLVQTLLSTVGLL
jgi:hypothetical protein